MFKLTLNTDNAAFSDDVEAEVSRILIEVARRVHDGIMLRPEPVFDINGNAVGYFELSVENETVDDVEPSVKAVR